MSQSTPSFSLSSPEIFHSYDIRGTYPDALNGQDAYLIGRAYIHFLDKHTNKEHYTIAVGRDSRISSPELFEGFARGVREEGADIIDLGLITTPMLYYGVASLGCDGGAMITASHNPNPYNGLKLTREHAIPIGGDSGLYWMRDFIEKTDIAQLPKAKAEGSVSEQSIRDAYVDFNLQTAKIERDEFRGMRVAVDAGNGVGGPMIQDLLEAVGVTMKGLYMEPDGQFPNHIPDPLIAENIKDLQEFIKEQQDIQIGIALDGDADRVVLLDENANPVSGDILTAFIAQIILRDNPMEKILYDVRSSNIVPESITQNGGTPIVSRIGHAHIKPAMREENILFGGEFSGHYFWGQNLFFETPFVVVLLVLKELKGTGKKLSELIVPFQKYAYSGEINFAIEQKEKKIQELKQKYVEGTLLEIDGARIDFEDWWFLARPSNTESLLRLVIEAKTPELLEQKRKEITEIISS